MDAKRKAIPKSIRMTVYQKCNGHCAYCGCSLEYKDMQVDHVIPLNGWSEQGTDTVDNMIPACRSCNHYKSRSTLEGFRKMVSAMPALNNVLYVLTDKFKSSIFIFFTSVMFSLSCLMNASDNIF